MSRIKFFDRLASAFHKDEPETTKKVFGNELLAIRNGNFEVWEQENNGALKSPYDNSTVRRAIDLIASNIAQVPILIFKGEEKVAPNFELYSVFRKPNDYTSRYELVEQTLINFKLYGEAFWFLNLNEFGIIREIYVLHPMYMKHVQKDQYSPISGWIYNNKIPMKLEQVIHFKTHNPYGGVRGLSLLDTVLTDLQADKEASTYNKSFFKNGTRVNGMIELDKEMSATVEEMRRVLAEFKKEHQGSTAAYKVGILSPGMKYTEYGQTMRDMEYIGGRDSIRDRILIVLGVHKSVIGVTDKIDRATADVALKSLWSITLKPDCVRIQEKLNAELFDLYYPGLTCQFDYSAVEELKQNINSSLEAAIKFMELGYTRNEVNQRLTLGMETSEEGDERYISSKLKPVDEVVAPEPAPKKADDNPAAKKLSTYLFKQRNSVVKTIIAVNKLDNAENLYLKDVLTELFVKENKRIEKVGITSAVNKHIFNQILLEIDEAAAANENIDQLADRVKLLYENTDLKEI